MDFGVPEIRDWLPLLREVCRNYDVYGIEQTSSVTLSFQVLGRGEAAATGTAEMTGLLHASGHDDEVGRTRGRPNLLAVRVPTPSSTAFIGWTWIIACDALLDQSWPLLHAAQPLESA